MLSEDELVNSIQNGLETSIRTGEPRIVPSQSSADIGRSIQIIHESGQLLFRTGNAPEIKLPFKAGFQLLEDLSNQARYGYYDIAFGIWIIASQDLELANDTLFFRQLDIFLPPVLLIILAALLMISLIPWALKPLFRLNDLPKDLASLERNQIELKKIPVEIYSFVDTVNRFFAGFEQSLTEQKRVLEREKRFAANAAHELMTPLAAIRSEVQLRQKRADDDDTKQVMQGIISRIDRATHTVDQLINLARLDPEHAEESFTSVDLIAIIRQVVIDVSGRIEAKQLDFNIESPDALEIKAIAPAIQMLIRNLMDNAVRYCPDKGKIQIKVNDTENTIGLVVENSSKPLPNYVADALFENFVRGPEETETGSGIGLSIVKRVVDIHKGEIKLQQNSEAESLRIEIPLPPPAPLGDIAPAGFWLVTNCLGVRPNSTLKQLLKYDGEAKPTS